MKLQGTVQPMVYETLVEVEDPIMEEMRKAVIQSPFLYSFLSARCPRTRCITVCTAQVPCGIDTVCVGC